MKPIFICVQPDHNHYIWQIEAYLDNNIRLGIDNESHILMHIPTINSDRSENLLKLVDKYKDFNNIKFFYYRGDRSLDLNIQDIEYIPLLRPFTLNKHWQKYPYLKDQVIFYHDCDILFVRPLDFSKLNENNTCYISYTGARFSGGNYLNIEYFDNKSNDVLISKKEEYNLIDPLDVAAKAAGITRKIIELNDKGTGGAQYLLKNIDSQFWKDVYESSRKIRMYLKAVNRVYFASEDAGFQSWCTDMWALLWSLWARGIETKCPEELDFAWGTDPIEKLDKVNIYHNAGVTSPTMEMNQENTKMFYKNQYAKGEMSPYEDKKYLAEVSNKYCSGFYAQQLLKTINPIF